LLSQLSTEPGPKFTQYSYLPPDLSQIFEVVKSTPDGSCLYHTLSILLCGDQSLSKQLRVRAAYTLIKLREQFWRTNLGQNFHIGQEVVKCFDESAWGGEPQILALAQVVRRDLVVLHAHVDGRAGDCPLQDCVKLHPQMHLHYKAQQPIDRRKYVILFSPTSHRDSLVPGTLPNHFSPLLRRDEKIPCPPSLEQIRYSVALKM